jgi:hypothetical protein
MILRDGGPASEKGMVVERERLGGFELQELGPRADFVVFSRMKWIAFQS